MQQTVEYIFKPGNFFALFITRIMMDFQLILGDKYGVKQLILKAHIITLEIVVYSLGYPVFFFVKALHRTQVLCTSTAKSRL